MANRRDLSYDGASCSSTRCPRGRSPRRERSRERSLCWEGSASSSCSRRHHTSNDHSLEDRVRRIEESQNKILQLLQEARQPARELRKKNYPPTRPTFGRGIQLEERPEGPPHHQKGTQHRRNPRPEKEYTPLNTSRTNILRNIQDKRNVRWPQPLKPGTGNQEQYCRFHRSRGHITEQCKLLREEIERLIRQGYLGGFMQNRSTSPVNAPTGGQDNNHRITGKLPS